MLLSLINCTHNQIVNNKILSIKLKKVELSKYDKEKLLVEYEITNTLDTNTFWELKEKELINFCSNQFYPQNAYGVFFYDEKLNRDTFQNCTFKAPDYSNEHITTLALQEEKQFLSNNKNLNFKNFYTKKYYCVPKKSIIIFHQILYYNDSKNCDKLKLMIKVNQLINKNSDSCVVNEIENKEILLNALK